MYYFCIACMTIDSVIRMEKKNYPQVYLEECKYKIKKIKMDKFIDTELESDSESELESNTELEAKLESDSDSEQFFTHMVTSQMVAYCFERVKKNCSHFADLKQSKKLLVILLTLN